MIEIIAALLASSLYLQPGQTWSANWSDGHNRTLYPSDIDPFSKPANVDFSGTGTSYTSGQTGVMSLMGDAPRYRVLEKFQNSIITVYMKRISEAAEIDYAGIVIGARSQHFTDNLCGANTLYGQLNLDGSVRFEKELFHGSGEDAFYPRVEAADQIYAFPNGIPKQKWIGLKFIVQNTANNTAVLMQLYIDKNDTGDWQKILEYTDKGNWAVKPGFKNINKKCDGYYPKNKILLDPGFVFLRNDGLGRADYKNFTIRELA